MRQQTFTIQHAVGLHARPAARFVKLAKTYESKITVRNVTRNGDAVDAKSLVRVIKIAAAQHQEVEVIVDGPDEETAFDGLAAFLSNVPEEEK
jgi:phosphotransferase system HPr (HPr) family protein